jgi:hypothetical protein
MGEFPGGHGQFPGGNGNPRGNLERAVDNYVDRAFRNGRSQSLLPQTELPLRGGEPSGRGGVAQSRVGQIWMMGDYSGTCQWRGGPSVLRSCVLAFWIPARPYESAEDRGTGCGIALGQRAVQPWPSTTQIRHHDINSRKYTHAVNRKLAASGPRAPPDPRIAVAPPPAAARSRKMENPDRDILRKRKTTTAFARLY